MEALHKKEIRMTDRFNFYIEDEIIHENGGCRPATDEEILMWETIKHLATEAEQLRKGRDELAEVLDDILHSAFEHGSQNLSGKTLDPDGEMLWKAKQLVNKIRNK